jgi:hypothetical protein
MCYRMQDISLKREVCGGAYSTPVFRVINVFHRKCPAGFKGMAAHRVDG